MTTEYDKAIKNLTQAIEVFDTLSKLSILGDDEIRTFSNSLYYRGISYLNLHKYSFAKKDFEKILNINPSDVEVRQILMDISKLI